MTLSDDAGLQETIKEKAMMLAQLECIQGRLAAMKRAAAGAYCTPAQFMREWLSDDAGLQETINKAKGI